MHAKIWTESDKRLHQTGQQGAAMRGGPSTVLGAQNNYSETVQIKNQTLGHVCLIYIKNQSLEHAT